MYLTRNGPGDSPVRLVMSLINMQYNKSRVYSVLCPIHNARQTRQDGPVSVTDVLYVQNNNKR